jgi:hypothetical protein
MHRMPETASTTRWSMLILLAVWVLSGVYVGLNLNRGWDPHDEGTLGQSAERVLHGEMPHLDFADPYTGGLAYIDSFIFKLFGINLFWLRLFLFAFFLVWVPTVYALAREFLPPLPSGAVTLIAVVWSVPNYTAAMPSWFNLFLATLGTLALAKYIREPAIHWLVIAGLCGGSSFLIKSVAIYYIAGALLFFVYREQSLSRNESAPPHRTPLYLAFLACCLSLFVFVLIKLVFNIGEISEYLHFVFPGVTIAVLLLYRERTSPAVPDGPRFVAVLRMAVPFLLAALLPIILFSIFYWRHGALSALMNGLFIAPFRRLLITRLAPNGLIFEYPSVLAMLLLTETAKLRGLPRTVLSIFLALLGAAVLLGSPSNDLAYIIGLTSALGAIPVLVVAALLVLSAKPQFRQSSLEADQQLALLLTMTTLFSMIQFPYSTPGYFWYVAPLVVLLTAALISRFSRPPRILLYATVAFYLLFPVFVLRPRFMGNRHRLDSDDTALTLPRAGGLRVSKISAAGYAELITFVNNLADDKPILAAPDCPEIYFLSGAKNPTPVLYDSLEDPRNYERDTEAVLNRPNFLKVVVVNDAAVSAVYQSQLLHSLVVARFPNSRKIGSFTVYWRP